MELTFAVIFLAASGGAGGGGAAAAAAAAAASNAKSAAAAAAAAAGESYCSAVHFQWISSTLYRISLATIQHDNNLKASQLYLQIQWPSATFSDPTPLLGASVSNFISAQLDVYHFYDSSSPGNVCMHQEK